MILSLVTEPTIEPLLVSTAKTHLRILHTDDDFYILSLITAVRKHVESFLGRALITQTWDMWIDRFPYGTDAVDIGKAPLQSVSAITYVDPSGATQTLSTTVYTVDANSDPGRVYLANNQTWPSTQDIRKAVMIRFVAGYGSAESNIPMPIIQAMLLLISHFYEMREPVITGTILTSVPLSAEYLLSPYRLAYL